MKSFIVADLDVFSGWNWDDWKEDTGEIGERMRESDDPISEVVIPEMEKLRPITLYQDQSVNGVDDNHSVGIAYEGDTPFTDAEFDLLWSEYGYKTIAMEEG